RARYDTAVDNPASPENRETGPQNYRPWKGIRVSSNWPAGQDIRCTLYQRRRLAWANTAQRPEMRARTSKSGTRNSFGSPSLSRPSPIVYSGLIHTGVT